MQIPSQSSLEVVTISFSQDSCEQNSTDFVLVCLAALEFHTKVMVPDRLPQIRDLSSPACHSTTVLHKNWFVACRISVAPVFSFRADLVADLEALDGNCAVLGVDRRHRRICRVAHRKPNQFAVVRVVWIDRLFLARPIAFNRSIPLASLSQGRMRIEELSEGESGHAVITEMSLAMDSQRRSATE